MFQRLKLLRRLQKVDRSPEEAWALLECVKTHTSSADDRERLAHLIRVTTEVTEQLRGEHDVQTPPVSQRLSPQRQAKRKRQLAKAARRRHRRERSANQGIGVEQTRRKRDAECRGRRGPDCPRSSEQLECR